MLNDMILYILLRLPTLDDLMIHVFTINYHHHCDEILSIYRDHRFIFLFKITVLLSTVRKDGLNYFP